MISLPWTLRVVGCDDVALWFDVRGEGKIEMPYDLGGYAVRA